MAKNKKKKNEDFQKVKLKIGRKLKRDSNETKAEFSSRKIILKEVKKYSDDPLAALSRHSERISQRAKENLLHNFNRHVSKNKLNKFDKPTVDGLAKFIIDHSDIVRAATYKCLRTCYEHIDKALVRDYIAELKPYLDLAYTHISRVISSDCYTFLSYLVNKNEPRIFEILMPIILRRYDSGYKNLGLKLKHFYALHKRKQIENHSKNDGIVPVRWSETPFFLDFDRALHCLNVSHNPERDVLLVPKPKAENVVQEFLARVGEDGATYDDRQSDVAQVRRHFQGN